MKPLVQTKTRRAIGTMVDFNGVKCMALDPDTYYLEWTAPYVAEMPVGARVIMTTVETATWVDGIKHESSCRVSESHTFSLAD